MNPRELSIRDFSYILPEEKIATFPLEQRDQSKLLVFKDDDISADVYANIAGHLPEGSLLVFNDTRVVEARMLFQKPTGGVIEIFALEPGVANADTHSAMQSTGKVLWKCLIGGAGKWKHGQVMQKSATLADQTVTLDARITERLTGSFMIEFSWKPDHFNFAEMLHLFGSIPIPPYLKRESALSDEERYQTIYAEAKGSVAAPTAGLHFTKEVFKSLQAKKISIDFLTLHVGAGTFMPVKSEKIGGHEMHAEFLQVDKNFLQRILNHRDAIFAVGTTSLRTLESLYWMGLKCHLNPGIEKSDLEIKQWDVYDELESTAVSSAIALQALIDWLDRNRYDTLVVKTSILIAPPYKVKMIKGLVTNFHQPNSTLLLLVAALIGKSWTKVYDYALENDFRFLSYGDGCLLYV